jgi:hypothetical protein
VVDPFTIPGIGRGCYFTDPPAFSSDENDPEA